MKPLESLDEDENLSLADISRTLEVLFYLIYLCPSFCLCIFCICVCMFFFVFISVNLQTGFTLGGFLCEAGWYPAATTVHRFWFWGSHNHRHFHFHNYDITSKTLSFPQSMSCQSEKTQPGECHLDKMCPKIFLNLKYAPLQKITKATSTKMHKWDKQTAVG